MLKLLKLRMELKEKRESLKNVIEQHKDYQRRTAEIEAAMDEAATEEELEIVKQNMEDLENDYKDLDLEHEKENLENQIRDLEQQLQEIDEKAKAATNEKEKRGVNKVNRVQAREEIRTGRYYERSDVKEFYESLRNIRSLEGGELTIPDIVINRIMDIVGDYTTVYPLVDKVTVKGTTRIIIDTDTEAAEWMEMKQPLQEGNAGTPIQVTFDGYKVGKVICVDNYLMQDSIINVDDYVTKKIARSIAKALDKSIIAGEGEAKKQPTGIITSLPADHKVTVTAGKLIDLVKPISLIDTGEDAIGEIVAVVKRQTYYNRLLEYSIQTDSKGNVVGKLPNLSNPDLLGLRVEFNNNVPDDAILYGDYMQYTIVERENITIDPSTHAKFVEDMTAFRGKGRFDGKPVKPNAFVLVQIQDKAA